MSFCISPGSVSVTGPIRVEPLSCCDLLHCLHCRHNPHAAHKALSNATPATKGALLASSTASRSPYVTKSPTPFLTLLKAAVSKRVGGSDGGRGGGWGEMVASAVEGVAAVAAMVVVGLEAEATVVGEMDLVAGTVVVEQAEVAEEVAVTDRVAVSEVLEEGKSRT